jgi:hypothetical protein
MNSVKYGALLLLLGFAMSCSESPTSTDASTQSAFDKATGDRNFTTQLTPEEEVDPVDSDAHGVAKFKLSKDGTELSYKINVANIENVAAAHIHRGAPGVNGPVIVGLYSAAPAGGSVQGVLVEGVITAATVGGEDAFDNLIDEIQSGNTYVNVHTNDGIVGDNTGPGDMARGEIRGQL